MNPNQAYLRDHFAFAVGRFDDGARFLRYFEMHNGRLRPPPRDVLDIGTGSGRVGFAFANCTHYRVCGIDVGQNRVLREVARSTKLPLRYSLASGHHLPFAAESFDITLLVDALEHIPRPRQLGAEIIRVLRPGGVCLITTPARVKYLFRAEPHYGVRFIAGLPNSLQRFIVNRVLGRRLVSPDGSSSPAYDVERLYWHVEEIVSLFPGSKNVDVLFGRPPVGGPVFSGEWLYRKLRNFFFDHVLLYKDAR